MTSRIAENVLGIAYWTITRVGGALVGVVLLLAPLELAAIVDGVTDLPPTASFVAGTAVAAAFGLPPWSAASRLEGVIAIGSVGLAWLAWPVIGGTLPLAALGIGVVVGGAAWTARRLLADRALRGAVR